MSASQRIVAGDIGGTSSRFAAFEIDGEGRLKLLNTVWLKTAEAKSFAELIAQLQATDLALRVAEADFVSIAIAGPIERQVYCQPTWIDWDVDLSHADRDFGFRRFALLNDFLAQAFAVCTHIGNDAAPILPGTPAERGAIAVIGAGTGLGKAVLVPTVGGHYIGVPSEGGHSSFAPENPRELEFGEFVRRQMGGAYAEWDDIVSGRGIALVHEFLTGEQLSPAEAAKSFEQESETLEWVVRFYARVCRNYALEVLSTGGIFIAGGVAAKNPVLLTHPLFAETFLMSRAHRRVLEKMPIRLIDNQESGLWGAAQFGLLALKAG